MHYCAHMNIWGMTELGKRKACSCLWCSTHVLVGGCWSEDILRGQGKKKVWKYRRNIWVLLIHNRISVLSKKIGDPDIAASTHWRDRETPLCYRRFISEGHCLTHQPAQQARKRWIVEVEKSHRDWQRRGLCSWERDEESSSTYVWKERGKHQSSICSVVMD